MKKSNMERIWKAASVYSQIVLGEPLSGDDWEPEYPGEEEALKQILSLLEDTV